MFAEPEGSTDSIPHPLAKRAAAPVATAPAVAFAPDAEGDEIAATAEPYLAYLTDVSRQLGLIDPVETYFRPLLGRWGDLGAEAGRLRTAAAAAADVSARLDDRLGRLDAGWAGRDADAFVAYMREIGAAGGDLQEAFTVLADALDELVTTLRHVVVDLAEVLVDAADLISETMMLPSGGTKRARTQLRETQDSAKALYETARDVLEAFDRLCDGVDDPDATARSIEIAHRYPGERFQLHEPESAATTTAAAGSPAGSDEVLTPSSASGDPAEPKHTGVGTPDAAQPADAAPQPAPAQDSAANHSTSGMPMMPMMGFGSFGGGGGGRRQPKTRPTTSSSELLGEPGLVAPPVIGEDENAPQQKKKPPAPPAK
ncbi:Proteins of 100 residues with WXG [Amycolatopsis pretoriensis]|uniref:Proteins of 100 residues with WXG n=1 Tax=Amycolatopsis pretoriensis TaxID=218821 RepID=A0A1H5R1H3_9PSEU|nr:WXG100 family type VII secretion target [Amycolatopsis pretoriensis]SEF31438.1 Proteins of 100 residues with WXG [Amycolatopsis pretoriensis]